MGGKGREGKGREGKGRKGKERKGKERKGKERKGIENYQLLELRKVVKENKETVQCDFREKYRELRVESNRGKAAETLYMGKQSISRQRYNEHITRKYLQ